MELDIDFSIAEKYSEPHEFYSRHLSVFKNFIRVFGVFFKKEKFQHAEIKIDEEAKNKAIIRFCGKKYRIRLAVDPVNPKAAVIVLAKLDKDRSVTLSEAAVVDAERVIFPGERPVSLKDSYEFNNAVLNFFISGITRNPDTDHATR
jgi:hypothetical protein